jgi:hypothetical protein
MYSDEIGASGNADGNCGCGTFEALVYRQVKDQAD